VHEAIADGELRKNVLRLYDEVTPTLLVPSSFDLGQYQRSLVQRFENNKLPHQLKQIAMDGSQKLPQRIFPSLKTTEERGLPQDILILAISEWVKFCRHLLMSGSRVEDPDIKLGSDLHWDGRVFKPLQHLPSLRRKIFAD